MQARRYTRPVASTPDSAVLAGARRAFERYGYSGATIERIAAEAGVSRVTLHRRGVDRDQLLAQLVEAATADYRAALWPALTASGSGAQRLEAALVALCEQAEVHMPLLVALRAQSDRVFHREDQDEALTRSVFTEPLERLLRDGINDGTLRDVEPTETATVLFNLVGWTYIHLRNGHGWSPERALRSVLDIALSGVTAQRSDTHQSNAR